MDRSEATGLGIALVGHAVLFGILSVGLASAPKPKPPLTDPIDVQLVDLIGLRSASPAPAEEPSPSEAEETGVPEEAAPAPAPDPAPEPEPPNPRVDAADPSWADDGPDGAGPADPNA